jgi:serine/threonine-protein kinase
MALPFPRKSLRIEDACSELEAQLYADPTVRAERFLSEHPEWADTDSALDLIYTEYLSRCELARRRLAEDFQERFPQHAAEFRRQLAFDDLFDGALQVDSYPQREDSTLIGPQDAAPTAKTSPQSILQIDDRYELLEKIGRGGAAVVYRARQVGLDRIVALKLLVNRGDDAPLAPRLALEGAVIARLQHPNIVQVFEVGEKSGQIFLALEYCDGGTLEERMAQSRLSVREAAQLVRTLASAIEAAHQAGIVHRDLKPANTLFTADGVPKIADFGLAKLLEEESPHTRTGAILGTPCYIAPEQIGDSGHDITPAADIYALGAMFYELLTGRPPFVSATAMATLRGVQFDEPVPPRRLDKSVPRDLETICLKCLEKRPHDRYASAGQLADDLQRFLEHRPVTARPLGFIARLERHVRRRPAVWGLAATLLLSLLTGAGLAAWDARALQVQRLATNDAFETAFQRWHDLFLTARDGVETEVGKLPLEEGRRDELTRQFSRFLDEYVDEAPIRHDLVYGYAALAQYHRQNGDEERFEAFANTAQACARQLIREAATYPESWQHVPGAHYRLALLEAYRGRAAAAIDGFRRAASAAQDVLTSPGAVLVRDTHEYLAKSHDHAASLLSGSDVSAAAAEYELACREYRTMLKRWPNDADVQLRLVKSLLGNATCLVKSNRLDDVALLCEDAVSFCAMSKMGGDPALAGPCADGLRQIALALDKAGRADAAQSRYQQALELLEPVLAREPTLVELHRRLAHIHFQRGSCYQRSGRRDEAIAAYSAVGEHFNHVLIQCPKEETPWWVRSAHKRIGNLQRELALLGGAPQATDEALLDRTL